ncbi:hypothetical protein CBR_g224 [Chara braunii]|uniref:Transcription initiation factor TFIID subunit 15 n=1 Tax=Chara braunii TaxID=69332 RepID=A0A388JM46_CHABU|nr:hypothetical protein CBR_g224 [Chara braunii]|eukprot:GBG58823.1 hypothetical protein CBR_g224 [Chara braunii]
MMAGYGLTGVPSTNAIYVCNLPPGTDELALAEHFGTIGLIKKDKRTNRPRIWLYRDKATNEPKGDATVTYEDPHAAAAAVDWFDRKEFHGAIISVSLAENKKQIAVGDGMGLGVMVAGDAAAPSSNMQAELGGVGCHGRGRGEPPSAGGKPWQQDGDWSCPNPSCGNINFAFRGQCNRCGTQRPGGSSGGGAGRGRGRTGPGTGGGGREGRGVGGPPGLFGPNDWPCPMCGNINWAKRTKCNICNTTKPGFNEGGSREGRAGGYKELDEAELEETKRRRREHEEDDGEMYDDFGNLKKKFRARAKAGEMPQQTNFEGGKAGWEEALRASDRGDKSRERDREFDRGRVLDRDRGGEGDRERYGERDDYREWDKDRDRDRDWERDRDRGRTRDGRDDRHGVWNGHRSSYRSRSQEDDWGHGERERIREREHYKADERSKPYV